ncbi:EAL domain-containing protein [Brevibacillus composti]|uniref:EAL domain-containing protein n=1 Tax=Brevibacillus composti TaxID=2796470 RepID=A0A7T5EJG5_9BACL|nr:bifunctional diguanylate cyclase/phosphodiesterase [Brevibacillus composti]QQE73735.1 EAL domain-containing protein [Brevibacillus composti]QUO40818.1 EAL domain-containing protein [Brevibacillus composti]
MKSELFSLDVTEWDGLFQTNDRLKAVMRELADVKYALDQSAIVAITDRRGTILYANEQFCKISGYAAEELIGQDHRILNSGLHPKEFFAEMWATIGSGRIWRGEVRNRAKDGSYYWVDTTIVPFLDEDGKSYQYVSIRNDISGRKQMEEELKRSEEKYRLITENTTDLISVVDREGHFLYLSPSHEAVLGCKTGQVGSSLLPWIVEDDREIMSEAIQHAFSSRKSRQIEYRLCTAARQEIWVETTINPVITAAGTVRKLVLVSRDVTERKKSEQTIHHLAYHDTLTDLPNRRLFVQYLSKELSQAKRVGSKLAVLFLDLDRLKDINDAWGHDVGDLILIEAAKRLKGCIRNHDMVARLGGDEFTIVLTSVSGKEEVESIVHRLQSLLQKPLVLAGQTFTLSMSIGIALYPQDGVEADDLLKRADTALYVVKSRGRNSYEFFDPTMEAKTLERILMENELRKAINQGHFDIYYQPKTDLATGKLTGMEALVRWIHPELGVIPPNRFIPIAEETGMIIELGEWILRQACRQNKEWQNEGFPPLKVSVNLSARQLHQKNLTEVIETILKETGLEPKWLELEITESILVKLDEAIDTLQAVRQSGVQISIDDFGTGYNSFSYIKHLPIDTIKIDSSFIQDIHQNQESQAIVKAIVTIAESLNLNVIAEGVELLDQVAALSENGCDQGQGYLFSKPLPTKDFKQYLQTVHHYGEKPIGIN